MNSAAHSSSCSQSRLASALVAVWGVCAGIHADILKGNLFLLFGIAITGALSRLATLAGMIAALKVIMLAVKHGHLPISIALLMKHLGVESSSVQILILGSGVFIIFFAAWTVSCLSIFLQKYFEEIKIENTLRNSDLLDANRLGRFESRMSAARTVMRLLEVMFFLILFSSLIFLLSPILFLLLLLLGVLIASGLVAFNKRRASLLLTKQKLKSKLINTKISRATPKHHCISSKVKFREKYFNVSSDLRLLAAQSDNLSILLTGFAMLLLLITLAFFEMPLGLGAFGPILLLLGLRSIVGYIQQASILASRLLDLRVTPDISADDIERNT